MPKTTPRPTVKTKGPAPKTVAAKKPAPKAAPQKVKAKAPAKTAPKVAAKIAAEKLRNYFYANGKRKTAVALVRLFPDGKGEVQVNGRPLEKYFPLLIDQEKVLSPLKATNLMKQMDIAAKAFGGGVHAQAEAIRHGISKALLRFRPEARSVIKPLGFLTRDSRMKERKKYGLKRARRAPQWQKR